MAVYINKQIQLQLFSIHEKNESRVKIFHNVKSNEISKLGLSLIEGAKMRDLQMLMCCH